MNLGGTARRIVFSWDWIVAFAIVLAASFLIPEKPSVQFAKELFSIGISVLAIVFSLFLTSLAILITSGDNEFIRFLEEDGSYRSIVATFKVTFALLAISLVLAIVLSAITLRMSEIEPQAIASKWLLLGFSFLGMYALLATVQSSFDMLKYAELRARFLSITKSDDVD